jgi:hypothetical protein
MVNMDRIFIGLQLLYANKCNQYKLNKPHELQQGNAALVGPYIGATRHAIATAGHTRHGR